MMIKSYFTFLIFLKINLGCLAVRTWFDFDEMEAQWIKEGLIPEYTSEEKILKAKTKRRSDMLEKQSEYFEYRHRENEKSVFRLDDKPSNERPKGPALISASLSEEYIEQNRHDDEPSELTWDQLADICDDWLYRINFVVEQVACYPNSDVGMLFTVKYHWQGEDVWKFLLTRKEIGELNWNDKTVHPYKNDERTDDEL
jgi:hypothetical protein